jgi:hypothetical protein
MFKSSIVEKIYPDTKIVGILNYFKPNVGWIIDNHYGDIKSKLKKYKSEGIEIVTLIIEDEYGFEYYPDFSIKELLGE